ncbi:MAG: hypothetical protein KatS3mg095_0574 [Candidatus Parcubacteria bacterium]|nr:MAG: hypothetical protein KatS3mg095_0574 [Candidatus Parcubacteria bacterium]
MIKKTKIVIETMINGGQVSSLILFFIFLIMSLFIGSSLFVTNYLNFQERKLNEIKALNIAESGIEYYRWFLNHFPTDYTDGTNRPGPYVHPFTNRLGDRLGEFVLDVSPITTGTYVAVIRSTGKLSGLLPVEKTIRSTLGRQSIAKFAFLLDDNVRFGSGTTVYGEIHSNKGIRFDGIAYNWVKSSLLTYKDPDHAGCEEWAVHTHVFPVDPCPPTTLPQRNDVFKVGRQVGVQTADFVGISASLSNLKNLAQDNGRYFGYSGDNNYGYEIIFKENNFDVYRVKSIIDQPRNCLIYDVHESYGSNSRFKHSTWSIKTKDYLGAYNYPSNGVIFVEDNVWLSGQIKNKKIIVGAAIFPEQESKMPNIIINNDLKYTFYDGSDSLGLIAQKNINIGLKSEDDLEIDGALLAQNGRVGRYLYDSNCGQEYKRSKIRVFGSIISRKRYGFSWVSGGTWVSGYNLREIFYDNNLLYYYPPYFPIASEFYSTLLWEIEK